MEEKKQYQPQEIESKWQQFWLKEKVYQVDLKKAKNKFYCLTMFIYPSADKLHIGHWYNYGPADSFARFKKMQGFNVFSPIGYDAFGLPAENYAIKKGVHPQVSTDENIKYIRQQLKAIGAIYDWDYEINTSEPEYYRWTQWVFLQLYKKGLAYRQKAKVNWCPSCQTVLANEQVKEGLCERCDSKVVQKEMTQWFFRITKYAEELLNHQSLDWPAKSIAMQKNWIGRSEGALINFEVKGENLKVEEDIGIFTTRPDTIFGATYLVVAPEHPLVARCLSLVANRDEVENYLAKSQRKSELERTELAKEKTGVELKGIKAVNPANQKEIPVWVADYVVMSYGTGVIMAVPAHDERDWEFAKKYQLPIIKVIKPPGVMNNWTPEAPAVSPGAFGHLGADLESECWTGDGIMINSGKFNGLDSVKVKEEITKLVGGQKKVNYKLHDWLISRQRYWGAPIPIVYCEQCGQRDKMTVLLIHGTGGDGRANWFGRLADELRILGHEVIAPDMPNPNEPVLEKWLAVLNKYRDKLNENSVIIGHSLGGPAALHFVSSLNNKISKLILVAPTYRDIDWVEYARKHPEDPVEYQQKFNQSDISYDKVHKHAKDIIYYYSDNDFYIPESVPKHYQKVLKADFRLLPGRDHFSTSHGNAYILPEVFEEIVGKNPAAIGIVPVPEKDLPVRLPAEVDFKPKGESPLARSKKFVETKCPKCGGPAKREVDTMDTFVCSSWYYFRYLSPHDNKKPFDKKLVTRWLPVDMYVGGAEHITMHLIYARFVAKVLMDDKNYEPFRALRHQGTITKDGAKMSKSRGNVVIPDQFIKKYGADCFRMFLMFMGPYEQGGDWNDQGILGIKRFLERVWNVFNNKTGQDQPSASPMPSYLFHQTIKKVTEDLENFRFNTAISSLMILFNELSGQPLTKNESEVFLKLLAPLAPHLVEELWQGLGYKKSIFLEKWPSYDPKMIRTEEVEIVIQVNGKLRDTIKVATDSGEAEVKEAALNSQKVKLHLKGELKKVIFVKNKLINFVI